MSKLQINTLVDLPDLIYPLEEVCSKRYVAGYFVGTSFHVLVRTDNFEDAKSICESYSSISHRQCYIFKSLIYIQKIY